RPFFKKYKIQKHKVVTWPLLKESLKLQLKHQIFYIFPIAVAQLLWVPPTVLPAEAPPLIEFCGQILLYLFMFDASYFFFHLAEHKARSLRLLFVYHGIEKTIRFWIELILIRWLYRWCHSVHHEYNSPFAATTQHLHPFELFLVGAFTTTIPWILDTHPLTYWAWFFVAQSVSYEEIKVHTGYDFPFALHRFIPFYGGAPAHDMHHQRPLTSFQPIMNYLDRLFGYYVSYEDLLKMRKEQAEKYGHYDEDDEKGCKKIN
uniref:Fatty acid hydroxylase domain-containing protein n=1 Tax=Steinernema glaseri TaxID=37863 RepID=A0A1I8AED2_9BILA